MNPHTGAVYEFGPELLERLAEPFVTARAELLDASTRVPIDGEPRVGDRIDMERLREVVASLDQATADEIAAAREDELVLISAEAAHRLKLGERERDRRRRRRKASSDARRRNR